MFRVGLIGIGSMGYTHLRRFLDNKINNATLTAVCDVNEETLYKYKDEIGSDVHYFTDANEMINSGTVDGIIIATPHYDHPIIAMDALKAGVHVLAEKPIGVFTKNVKELNELAKNTDKAFQVDFLMRTRDVFKKIKKMVDDGELGEIKRVVWIITDWYRTQAYYNSGGWRATWAGEGGGTMLNQNPHQLDLLQWILGVPARVRASCYFGKNRDIEVEDEVTAYFEYPNGAIGLYMTSVSEFPGTNRLEIAGDNGKLVYENNKLTFFKTEIGEKEFNKTTDQCFGPIPLEEINIEFEDSSTNDEPAIMINNWVDVAMNGGELIAPGVEGINSLAMSNAMYLSAWKDSWVEIPFDDDEFYNELKKKIDSSTFVKKNEFRMVNAENAFHK